MTPLDERILRRLSPQWRLLILFILVSVSIVSGCVFRKLNLTVDDFGVENPTITATNIIEKIQ